ncbi:hypothetical protein [Paenibacillus cymbidii]|uniref:hypothetical protein n=1 Tax=Paenibacillus cymbidii TaxID=1639034 RepID=UPI0010805D66|nr:hypothetical protein [Paenibacillus cymbidii]
MPRLLYEYIYVNCWLLLAAALMLAHDGQISALDGAGLMALAIGCMCWSGRKQLRKANRRG